MRVFERNTTSQNDAQGGDEQKDWDKRAIQIARDIGSTKKNPMLDLKVRRQLKEEQAQAERDRLAKEAQAEHDRLAKEASAFLEQETETEAEPSAETEKVNHKAGSRVFDVFKKVRGIFTPTQKTEASREPELSYDNLPSFEEYASEEIKQIKNSVTKKRAEIVEHLDEIRAGKYKPHFEETQDKAELRAQQEIELECADMARYYADKRSVQDFIDIDERVYFADINNEAISEQDKRDARMLCTAVRYAILSVKRECIQIRGGDPREELPKWQSQGKANSFYEPRAMALGQEQQSAHNMFDWIEVSDFATFTAEIERDSLGDRSMSAENFKNRVIRRISKPTRK